MSTWSVSAAWIVPVDGEPVRDGLLRGRGDTVEAVGPAGEVQPAERHEELGNVAVLPGLVNAHTHLDLSHLRGRMPRGRAFTQWLYGVYRSPAEGPELRAAVELGAREALRTGTTALADHCQGNLAFDVLRPLPLRALCLAGVSGIGPAAGGAIDRLTASLEGLPDCERIRFGIAPHAPYSTAEEVYRHAIDLARGRGWPVATHLAQDEAERQFLLHGSGRFFDFLGHMGMLDSTVTVQGCKPMQLARRTGLLDGPSILAHVNYIDDQELALLAASEASVVYCPRSCEFFRHGRHGGHRYAEMLAAGVNVALGTDSLASTRSMEMLEEMRRVRNDGKVDNATILRMATCNGARALGWDDRIGTLSPGKQADWIAVELPEETFRPTETILTSDAMVLRVVIGGETVYRTPAPTAPAPVHEEGATPFRGHSM